MQTRTTISSCASDTLDKGLVCDLSKNCVSHFFKSVSPKLTVVRHWADGNGSCFFHSLAIALCVPGFHEMSYTDQQKEGHKLRQKVLQSMTSKNKSWSRFWNSQRHKMEKKFGTRVSKSMMPEFNEFREKISDVSVMSDQYIIMYALYVLDLNCYFYDRKKCKLFCGIRGTQNPKHKTVIILWCNTNGNLHFEPLVRQHDSGRILKKRFFRYKQKVYQGNFAWNDPLIRTLRKRYLQAGCGEYEF